MKKKVYYLLFLSFFVSGSALGQPKIYNPRVSAAASVSQKIGITDVTVDYSQPSVIFNGNDRTGKVYGTSVAHYGYQKAFPTFGSGNDFPWRAGANENTTVTFSTDVKIEGQALPAGKYGLFIELSEEGNETVIFSKNNNSWGSFFYNQSEDALRVNIQSKPNDFTNRLTYSFEETTINQSILTLKWEKKKFPIKIDVATTDLVLNTYREKLPEFNDPNEYLSAANYCFQNRINYEEAIQWANKSIEAGKNFNNLSVKAGLIFRKDGFDAAEPHMDKIAEIANLGELNRLGYQLIQIKQPKKAVEYFLLNVKRNPKDPNVHDSLGEAYKAIGENKKAIKSFKKSLSLNPPQNVKDNSIAQLKELGVNYKQ